MLKCNQREEEKSILVINISHEKKKREAPAQFPVSFGIALCPTFYFLLMLTNRIASTDTSKKRVQVKTFAAVRSLSILIVH